MFRRASKRQVLWPVIVSLPAEDGSGTIVEHPCKLLFQLINEKQWLAMETMTDKECEDEMVRHIKDWEDIADEDGEPLPFTEDNLRALLRDNFFARAAAIGLWQASQGAPAKNF